MALRITEFFGFAPLDPEAYPFVAELSCPFVQHPCIKPRRGACSFQQSSGEPVIACPNRLYAQNTVLSEIAEQAFGAGVVLTSAEVRAELSMSASFCGNEIAVFGKYWGRELSIPQPRNEEGEEAGGFYIDYVLARLDSLGRVSDFTAVEIQTIDTTGNYGEQSEAFFRRAQFTDARGITPGWSKSGLNWANVSKRILPQLIYKGYVLRRERLCSKGLFFVCPSTVLSKVRARLGTKMLEYPIAAGTITFQAYDLGPRPHSGGHRPLVKGDTFTTTVEQVAYAFVSPVNLPQMGVYERAIVAALAR